jgi:hypothetical protein
LRVHDDSTVEFFLEVLRTSGRDVVISRVAARLIDAAPC